MRGTRHRLGAVAGAALVALCGSGCRGVYYDAMERLGREKRHILVDRVADGREEQRAAQEQFQSTLDAFKAVTGFEGGDLEAVYRTLDREYRKSEERAAAVRARIASIEQVADDLFDEWEDESGEISSASLRRGSEERLRETRRSYEQLLAAMRRAESRMDPVLAAFRDRVLYLKHNLNARAIASLEEDLAAVEADVERLVADMNASIAEAETFLAKLES